MKWNADECEKKKERNEKAKCPINQSHSEFHEKFCGVRAIDRLAFSSMDEQNESHFRLKRKENKKNKTGIATSMK